MTVREAICKAAALLAEGAENPRTEAEVLLAFLLQKNRAWLCAHDSDDLPDALSAEFEALCQRRAAGEPSAYITGLREFYGHDFAVGPGVLVPRSETELLVDEVVRLANIKPIVKLLDLCTGSGCIAASCALELPELKVFAQDISPDALKYASVNIKNLGLSERVSLFSGDLFSEMPEGELFSVITANPPYIGRVQGVRPDASVDEYEPALALYGGNDGLEIIRRIASDANIYLEAEGYLLMEIGCDQKNAVMDILHNSGYENISVLEDYSNLPRIALAQKGK
ncbi:MAG: peptide chain release factor N(5)-glutamine methyltransferase [bacterium]|nr:peptide chain release factor N(5)-glutamine methyltransferase [bacterium]